MKILANYHTHMYLCRHAEGHVEDYVKKAVESGYEEIGISDHIVWPDDWKKELHARRMTTEEFHNVYLAEINECKKKYNGEINVLTSLETEYLPFLKDIIDELKPFCDYLVLGQHWYMRKGYPMSVYADFSYNYPTCIISKDDVKLYSDSVCEALNTKLFKVLAHPEIIMIGYPKWDSYIEAEMRKIIESAIENNVYLEFNANGLRRGPKPTNGFSYEYNDLYMYPRIEFWKLVCEEYKYDKVLINDDCHSMKDLCDEYTKKAYQLLIDNNWKFSRKIEF